MDQCRSPAIAGSGRFFSSTHSSYAPHPGLLPAGEGEFAMVYIMPPAFAGWLRVCISRLCDLR
jgi:hypothetical protein